MSRAVDPGCAGRERLLIRYILEIIILVLRTARKRAHARLLIKTVLCKFVLRGNTVREGTKVGLKTRWHRQLRRNSETTRRRRYC